MQFPQSIRDQLVEDLENYLDAVATVDPEQVIDYLIEQIEIIGEDMGYDDIVTEMEEEGALDGSLKESLEAEVGSDDSFEFTGEEVVSVLERLVGIEWEYDEDDEDDDYDDEEEDEEEDEDDY